MNSIEQAFLTDPLLSPDALAEDLVYILSLVNLPGCEELVLFADTLDRIYTLACDLHGVKPLSQDWLQFARGEKPGGAK